VLYQVNNKAFLVFHIPSDSGAGDCVDGGGGAFTEGGGDAEGDAAGVSGGNMLHKSWQFVLRKPI